MHRAEISKAGRTALFAALLASLGAAPALALRPPGEEGQPSAPPPASLSPAPADEGHTHKAAPARSGPGSAPGTFTPSERIKADSAVSFPVDI